jgi:hypothetical protein
MPYSITTYSGTAVATVQDATINTTSSALTLIGRDYAGYGAFLNENFVYLLENFAGNTAPSKKLTGQIWYDTSVNTLKVWNLSANIWKPISSSIAQSTAPVGATSSTGDLWVDTNSNQLYVYNSGWQLIGPGTVSSDGTTSGAVVEVIKDSSDNDHTVLKFYIQNQVIGIVSYDAAFEPKNSINGFTTIIPGFNLVSSGAVSGSQLTGDASNARFLNGVASNQFLRSDQDTNTPYQLTVGNLIVGSALSINEDSSNNEIKVTSLINGYNFNVYANVSGLANTRILGISGTTGTVTVDKAVSLSSTLGVAGAFVASGTTTLVDVTTLQNKIKPNADGTIDIGESATKFANVYATNFSGTLTGNVVAGTISVGNVSIGADSITLSGNTYATQSFVASYTQTAGRNSQGTKIISTSPPSGTGTNGDIWYQV